MILERIIRDKKGRKPDTGITSKEWRVFLSPSQPETKTWNRIFVDWILDRDAFFVSCHSFPNSISSISISIHPHMDWDSISACLSSLMHCTANRSAPERSSLEALINLEWERKEIENTIYTQSVSGTKLQRKSAKKSLPKLCSTVNDEENDFTSFLDLTSFLDFEAE